MTFRCNDLLCLIFIFLSIYAEQMKEMQSLLTPIPANSVFTNFAFVIISATISDFTLKYSS